MNIMNFLSDATSTETHLPEGATIESLNHEEVAALGRQLLSGLRRVAHVVTTPPVSLLDISVYGLSQLMNVIPGLRTLDPDHMNTADAAKLARYVKLKEPVLFDEVMHSMAEEWPDVAEALMLE